MNIYGIVILAAVIGRFIIEVISERLNIRSLSARVPAGLQGLYDETKYRNSQEYTKTRSQFHLIESTFGVAVLLLFWFTGGFNHVDHFSRGFELNPLWTGIIYIGVLAVASHLLSLPFSIYSTFVIEEKFGFNKTTPRTFVMDRLKALLLMLILGVPVLALILWFFESVGPRGWLYAWLAVFSFSLVVQFVAPAWIMPLFNKFTPLQEGELKEAISNYAKGVRFAFRDIFVVDGSRRSTKPNAFFTGFGKHKRIALFDTLVAEHSIPEVVAVLAHEVGHYKMKHILKMMALSFFQLGMIFYLLSLFITNKALFAAFYMDSVSVYAGLLFFGLLFEPISFALGLMINFFSRKHELQADRFAVQTTDSGEHMISALKKLSVKTLSNLTPHPAYVFLNYSHPPLLERVSEILQVSSKHTV